MLSEILYWMHVCVRSVNDVNYTKMDMALHNTPVTIAGDGQE